MITANMNAFRLAAWRSTTRAAANRWTTTSRLYSSLSRICSACSAPLPTALPTCPKCCHIEPLPSSSTFFDLFGLQRLQNPFKIDIKDLRRRFLQAQSICHPDAWSGKGEREQDIAAAQSSILNEAYKTLQSPVLRAQYILTQEGYPPSETDKLTDRELIMEIMEKREELDEAESLEDVEQIRSKNQEKLDELIGRLTSLIEGRRWEDARDAVVKLKYLEGNEFAAKDKWDSLSR